MACCAQILMLYACARDLEMRNLHMMFIDLEKAYDKVPREVMWWELEQKRVSPKYISLIKDMYEGAVTGGEIPWCMLFADDITLIGESKQEVQGKLELWRQTLESKGFRLSRTKTEYLKCAFEETGRDDGELQLDGQIVPRKESFRYLGSVIQSDGEIHEDIRHRSQSGWAK
ncbi:uncharacterized protein LOC113350980 [Papaver somniferum]|uniref:uncharacterized protein LOC113350980 n=1 Tax=Papaver somniferum TaxID=3469 RepID=UPI000E6FAA53|nr:uncharacterized protein LOC113350980 [Papaver somniferum]